MKVKTDRVVPTPVWDTKCDGCGKNLDCAAIEVTHGYWSPLDGDEQEFCSMNCLSAWSFVWLTNQPPPQPD